MTNGNNITFPMRKQFSMGLLRLAILTWQEIKNSLCAWQKQKWIFLLGRVNVFTPNGADPHKKKITLHKCNMALEIAYRWIDCCGMNIQRIQSWLQFGNSRQMGTIGQIGYYISNERGLFWVVSSVEPWLFWRWLTLTQWLLVLVKWVKCRIG